MGSEVKRSRLAHKERPKGKNKLEKWMAQKRQNKTGLIKIDQKGEKRRLEIVSHKSVWIGVINPNLTLWSTPPSLSPNPTFFFPALLTRVSASSRFSLSHLQLCSHGWKRKEALSPYLSRLTVPPPHPFSCVSRQLHRATGCHPNDE